MSYLNALPTRGKATRPRGAVKLYDKDGIGQFITGWISWEVDNNAYRSADTFRVVFVVSMLPATRDPAWFMRQRLMAVEIFATADLLGDGPYVPAESDSLIYGQVDAIDFDPVRGTVELTGRDLTALLIDSTSTEEFTNAMASDIVRYFGDMHGLDVSHVHDAGSEFFGNVYKDDKTVFQTSSQTDWNVLCSIADAFEFALYVKGKELHFEPRPSEQSDHYVIAWEPPSDERGYPVANVISLQFSRALTIAKGITVEVHSWNAKQKKGFTASWPKAAKAVQPGQAAAKTQIHKYNIPGLMPDTALQRAQSVYRQIIAHEMRLTAYLPADNVLDCSKALIVRGTGTDADQVYFPESVTRTMSMNEGYRMNIRAKNSSPDLQFDGGM